MEPNNIWEEYIVPINDVTKIGELTSYEKYTGQYIPLTTTIYGKLYIKLNKLTIIYTVPSYYDHIKELIQFIGNVKNNKEAKIHLNYGAGHLPILWTHANNIIVISFYPFTITLSENSFNEILLWFNHLEQLLKIMHPSYFN
jgi:hypothetical protein